MPFLRSQRLYKNRLFWSKESKTALFLLSAAYRNSKFLFALLLFWLFNRKNAPFFDFVHPGFKHCFIISGTQKSHSKTYIRFF